MTQEAELTAWLNGEFLPLSQARVSVEDRGFQFADGVYEVIACYAGTFVDLDAHLQRLWRSCAAIELPPPMSRDELAGVIVETYRRNPFEDAMLYVQITRGPAPRAHLLPETIRPTVVVTARALPRLSHQPIDQGVPAITLEDFRWRRCEIKSIALLASVLGKQEAARRDADEAFWLDEDGHVLEGCSTNCFAVIHDRLVTHPLGHRVLSGITRRMVLKLAKRHGIKVEERPWRLDEEGLDEVFMTSTTHAAMPVTRIDGRLIGDERPGKLSLQVRDWLIAHIEELRG